MKPSPAWRGRLVRVGLVAGLVVAGVVAWGLRPARAEPAAYAEAEANGAVVIGSHEGFITLRPAAGAPPVGLLFYPGALVEPAAYVAKLSAVAAAANIQVVIGRPPLNLAFLSIGQADDMRAALPGVTRWYVGGHSLGGAMACLYASEHRASLEGLVLLGTYCGTDISDSALRILAITGERDGLFPPERVDAAAHELPAGAHSVRVAGMSHAQFGNYGAQTGDGVSTIADGVAREALVKAFSAFFSEQQPTQAAVQNPHP